MRFIVPPTPGRTDGASKMKILARDPNTQVTITGVGVQELVRSGSYRVFNIPASTFTYVRSNNPIMVAKFIGSLERNGVGKPSMEIIPPEQQFLSDYIFVAPNVENGQVYATVVIKQRHLLGLLQDGSPVDPQGWQMVLDTGSTDAYVGKSIRISAGRHRFSHTSANDATTAFGVYIYGYSPMDCGYAFAAGMCLDSLSQVRDSIFNF